LGVIAQFCYCADALFWLFHIQNFFRLSRHVFICLTQKKNKKKLYQHLNLFFFFLHSQGISKFNNTILYLFIYLFISHFIQKPSRKKWIFRFGRPVLRHEAVALQCLEQKIKLSARDNGTEKCILAWFCLMQIYNIIYNNICAHTYKPEQTKFYMKI
jgi:hypothetical protein